jgi:hypothetical protein
MACTETPRVASSTGIGLNQNLRLHQTGAGGHLHQAGDLLHLAGEGVGRFQQGGGVFALEHEGDILAIPRSPLTLEADARPRNGLKHLAGLPLKLPLGQIPLVLGLEQNEGFPLVHPIAAALGGEDGLHRWVIHQVRGQSLRHPTGLG